jgi:uncharacterized protein YabE (DUF348 family)
MLKQRKLSRRQNCRFKFMRNIINPFLKLFLGGVLIMGLGVAGVNSFSDNQESKENLSVPIIIEENGLQFNLKTDKKNITEVLTSLDIHFNQNDILFPAIETPISSGIKIIIKRALEITIEADGEIIKTFTTALNIKNALKEKNITLSEKDKTLPGLDESISNSLEIKIIRIKQDVIIEIASIDPPIEIRKDKSMAFGKTKIIEPGKSGKKEQTFLITYENGDEVEKKLVSEKIISHPRQKIIVEGEKISVGNVQTGQASWYAKGLWNPQALTAASNSFPKKTYLRVTNLENSKQVIVKVNDTGAFGLPRVIDLSSGAFKKLAPLSVGIISVKVEEIL